VKPGDEAKVTRCETKMLDWKRDVVDGSKNFRKEEMSADLFQLKNSFKGYWYERGSQVRL
jgi:hypothetical protein